MSLATSTILFEKRRYSTAVIAIAFCGALILSFTGLFSGVAVSYSALTNSTPAHLVVLNADAASWFDASEIPARVIPEIYSHPEVAEVDELDVAGANWSNLGVSGGAKRSSVMVISAVIEKNSLTMPKTFNRATIEALQTPLSVAIDRTTFRKLGTKLGARATINDQVVHVKAAVDGFPNASGRAMVFTSRQTGALLGIVDEGSLKVETLLVRLKDRSKAEAVRRDLEEAGGHLIKVWTMPELTAANQRDLFMNGGVLGIILIFLLLFGAIIGSVISWQTIKGAIAANLKEFASLSALGVPRKSLRSVVVEISLWLGAIGFIVSAVIFYIISLIGKAIGLPMAHPIWPFLIVGAVFLIISAISGALSLKILNKTEPAELLR
jgi:putative ABC transport system permease protein